MNSWGEVAAFALALRGTETGRSYGQPAVKVNGRMFVSTGHEPGSFHVRSPHEEKAVLLETDSATFWQTQHYANWPGLLVRYGATDRERVELVIRRAWSDAMSPQQRQASSRA